MNPTENEAPVQQVQSTKTVIAYLKMQYANLVWEEKRISEKKKVIIEQIKQQKILENLLLSRLSSEESFKGINFFNVFQKIVAQYWNDLLHNFKAKYNPDVCNMAPHLEDLYSNQIVLNCQSHTSNLWSIYKEDPLFKKSLDDFHRAYIGQNDNNGKLVVLRDYHKNFRQFMLRKDQSIIVFENMLAIKSSDGRPYTPITEEANLPASASEDINENLLGQSQVGDFDVEDGFDFNFDTFDFEIGIVPEKSTLAQKRQRTVNNNNFYVTGTTISNYSGNMCNVNK